MEAEGLLGSRVVEVHRRCATTCARSVCYPQAALAIIFECWNETGVGSRDVVQADGL